MKGKVIGWFTYINVKYVAFVPSLAGEEPYKRNLPIKNTSVEGDAAVRTKNWLLLLARP